MAETHLYCIVIAHIRETPFWKNVSFSVELFFFFFSVFVSWKFETTEENKQVWLIPVQNDYLSKATDFTELRCDIYCYCDINYVRARHDRSVWPSLHSYKYQIDDLWIARANHVSSFQK